MQRACTLILLLLSLVQAAPSIAHPIFIVTPERRAVWARMKADYDARPAAPATLGGVYFKLIKKNAECACKYGDTGIWGSLMYQMTQDPRYAALAWTKINETFLSQPDGKLRGNFTRETFTAYVLWYDWLHPALTPAQRGQFLAKLNVMAVNAVTNKSQADFPIRAVDSDQMVGDYFGLAMLYLATKSENPTIAEIWGRPYVGGFEATTGKTFRNVIKTYVGLARGGEWIESSEYNIGTIKLLALGYEAVRTARGKDDFPEIAELLPELALRQIHIVTSDLNQAYQWGDEEHPRDLQGRLFYREETAMVLAGLTQQVPAGRHLQDLVLALVDKYGATGYHSAEPWGRAFLVWNPYAPRESLRSLSPSSWAPGLGMLLQRTGWTADASLFAAYFPPSQPIDHLPLYFGEFQLYRKGDWALTHPLGYGGPPLDGRASNSMIIGGLPYVHWTFREFKQVVAQETSEAFAYVAGTTGGQVAAADSYNPPPTFLHEWTRSLVYLPGSVDTIVIHDRVNATDPRSSISQYPANLQQQIQGIPALKQWFVHAPERPQLGSGTADWRTARGSRVHLDTLLPKNASLVAEDERLLWIEGKDGAGNMKEEEKKWHVRVTPPADRQWDTFLNVLQVADGSSGNVSLVRSTGGEAEGALVERDGESALVLFNGQAGSPLTDRPGTYLPETARQLRTAHFRRTGFDVQFQAGVKGVHVYAFDLPSTYAWTAQVDGGAITALPVSKAGLGQLTVPGGGMRRLIVRPGAQLAPAIAPNGRPN